MRASYSFMIALSLVFAVFVSMTAMPAYSNGVGTVAPSEPQQPVIDEKATSLLKQMSDFLGSQDAAKVRIDSLTEVIYPSGLRLHTDRSTDIAVDRPDRMKSTTCNADRCVDIYYDGKTATVYTPAKNYYAAFDAPPTVAEFIDKAQDKYDMNMPAVDLLRRDSYDTLMNGVRSAAYIGQDTVRGVKTNHLAFRREDMDFELWIQEGAQPLPVRLIITDKSRTGSPMFAATFTDWDLSPTFPGDYFTFVPPEGATKIAFIQDIRQPFGAGPKQ